MWCVCVPRRGFMGSQTNPDAVAWVISMGISDGQRRRAADLLARVPRCGFMGSQTTKDVARLI